MTKEKIALARHSLERTAVVVGMQQGLLRDYPVTVDLIYTLIDCCRDCLNDIEWYGTQQRTSDVMFAVQKINDVVEEVIAQCP